MICGCLCALIRRAISKILSQKSNTPIEQSEQPPPPETASHTQSMPFRYNPDYWRNHTSLRRFMGYPFRIIIIVGWCLVLGGWLAPVLVRIKIRTRKLLYTAIAGFFMFHGLFVLIDLLFGHGLKLPREMTCSLHDSTLPILC